MNFGSHHTQVSLCPFAIPNPVAATDVLSLVLSSIEFQTMETDINLILVVVCVWLLSLSVTLLRFIHIVVQYPLMAEWYSIVQIYKNLIMHSPLMDIWVVSRFSCHK